MNKETNSEATTEKPPRSKRLSSFIWILVLWGGVRLFSELHPISWKSIFCHTATSFGLVPSSIALAISIYSKNHTIQKIFRWSAALISIGITCFGIALTEYFKYQEVKSLLITAQWFVLLIATAKLISKFRGTNHES
jgi:hypothetical protein